GAQYAAASATDSIVLPPNSNAESAPETPPRSPGIVPAGGPGVKPASRPARVPRTITISCSPDPVSGYREAREAASDNDRIVVFGSFSTVGPILQAIEQQQA